MYRRQKKQSKFGAYVIAGLIIFLMVGSILSVFLYAPQAPGTVNYNGYDVVFDDASGMFVSDVDGKSFRFYSQPGVAYGVFVDDQVIPVLRSASVPVITFDPTSDLEQLAYIDAVRYEFALAIEQLAGGVTSTSEVYPLPVYTCDDATAQSPVVLIKEGAANVSISSTNNYCIELSGNRTSLLLAKDALMYRYAGLIV